MEATVEPVEAAVVAASVATAEPVVAEDALEPAAVAAAAETVHYLFPQYQPSQSLLLWLISFSWHFQFNNDDR